MTDPLRWIILVVALFGFALLQGLAQAALSTLWEGHRPTTKQWQGLGIVLALSGACLVVATAIAHAIARDTFGAVW